MEPNDAELIHRMRRGDREALAAFYARYLPMVWRLVHSRVGPAACEDLVSDTFLAAIDGIATLDPAKGPVAAWLSGIARHKAADWLRRRPPSGDLPDPPADASLGPAARAQDRETRAAVAKVMSQLPDEERLALEWKYIEKLTVREIAHRLARTEKAVEALLYRARQEFRTRLESQTPGGSSNAR